MDWLTLSTMQDVVVGSCVAGDAQDVVVETNPLAPGGIPETRTALQTRTALPKRCHRRGARQGPAGFIPAVCPPVLASEMCTPHGAKRATAFGRVRGCALGP